MLDSKIETIVGFIVLIVATFFLYWLLQSNDFQVPKNSYEIVAEFSSAQGVGVGTEVRLAGIKVGSVSKMELNPETYKAAVYMVLDRDISLTQDSLFSIASESLLGGSYIEILPGVDGNTIQPGETASFTQSHVDFLTLLSQFVSGNN